MSGHSAECCAAALQARFGLTVIREQTAGQQPMSRARAHALRSSNGHYDAFSRGAHGTGEGAQIKAGLILLKKREDHPSVAVGAIRALIGRFAVEKRGNGTTEHRRLP